MNGRQIELTLSAPGQRLEPGKETAFTVRFSG